MYDVIVIGLGSMGSSALYHLAKAGVKVLGIEQFGISHDQGSHSGHTRIIRKAYFEHPNYVPLLEQAYKGWKQIEYESGEDIFLKTGLAYFGRSSHPVIKGVKMSSEMYQIPLLEDELSNSNQFHLPSNFENLLEPDAGFALTDTVIHSYIQQAKKNGAEVSTFEEVIEIDQKRDQINIITSKGSYKTEKLVITSGAYVSSLVDLPQLVLKVTRQLIGWVQPEEQHVFELGVFPAWMIEDENYPGVFYGFPILPSAKYGGDGLLKIAHHVAGDLIDPSELSEFDAENEKEKLDSIIRKYLPLVRSRIQSITACMYTNSVDDDFIIDFLPNSNEKIVIATGFSGHGFKFVPVIGEILKDLTVEGETRQPIEFLSMERLI